MRDSNRRGQAGFTLIEMLISVAMLMIIIGAIYGTFRAGTRSAALTEEHADVHQTARILLAQITSELCSAYQRPGDQSSLTGENTTDPEDELQLDMLAFLTASHRPHLETGPAGDLCRVTYYVETMPDGETMGLYMREDFLQDLSLVEGDDDYPPRIELSHRVIGMDCSYLDRDTGEWLDDWVEKTSLPAAVRVALVLREGAAPVTIASTANLPAIAGGQAERSGGGEDGGR